MNHFLSRPHFYTKLRETLTIYLFCPQKRIFALNLHYLNFHAKIDKNGQIFRLEILWKSLNFHAKNVLVALSYFSSNVKMSHLSFPMQFRHFPSIFVLSGNTVWPQDSRQFLTFLINFCALKCKRSSLRSHCWMRLFGRFSNTVNFLLKKWKVAWFLKHPKIDEWTAQNWCILPSALAFAAVVERK